MKEAIKDYFKLLHVPTLLLIAAVQILVFNRVIVPFEIGGYMGLEVMNSVHLTLLVVATLFIVAGGFVINDYYDLKIDQINRPLTRVVGQRLDKHAAMTLYIVLSAIGLIVSFVLCFLLKSFNMAITFATIVGFLWFYSSTYKRMLWLGNISAALLMGLVPIMVTIIRNEIVLNEPELSDMNPLVFFFTTPHATWLIGWTFVAEVIKDMATEKGDRELECHTFPIVYGKKWSKVIITIAILLTCAATGYMIYDRLTFEMNNALRYLLTCTAIPALSLIYIVWKAENPGDYRLIAKYVLAIMFLQLIFFYV